MSAAHHQWPSELQGDKRMQGKQCLHGDSQTEHGEETKHFSPQASRHTHWSIKLVDGAFGGAVNEHIRVQGHLIIEESY
jgi:hypothetical protein